MFVMLPTKKAKDLRVGDKLLCGGIITKIHHHYRIPTMRFSYTVEFNNPDGTPHHIGYDYDENANVLITRS